MSFHPLISLSKSTPFEPTTSLIANGPLSGFVPNTIFPIATCDAFLWEELDVSKFDEIERYLWMAGLPASRIRAFHFQRVVGRQIVITEQINLHLVTRGPTIFVKPIPGFLLHYEFFNQYITPSSGLYPLAMGFFSTYLRLIKHECDLAIALELGLVPSGTTWSLWLKFAEQLQHALTDTETKELVIFPGRYGRGELRLGRLNIIAQLFRGQLARGFITLHSDYNTYFSPFFAAAVIVFAYVNTAFSAFQVATAYSHPAGQLGAVGFWFAVVVLFAMAIGTIVLTAWFALLTVDNLIFASRMRR